jgi:hypothetical protein
MEPGDSNQHPHFLLELFIPSICLALFHRLTSRKRIQKWSSKITEKYTVQVVLLKNVQKKDRSSLTKT